MRRSRKRRAFSKERIIMVATTVLVLGTLTATGLWMGSQSHGNDDGYVVDLNSMEQDITSGLAEKSDIQLAKNITQESEIAQGVKIEDAPSDDLDYDPYFQETSSVNVENPDESDSSSMSDGATETAKEEPEKKETEEVKEQEAISTAMQPALTFSDEESLVWPISGNVLINYSMDKTIYFPTLEQYKYNPAIVIAANEGDLITAAASGKVVAVFEDREIGNAVTMELGNGYEVTYGQLTNILVSEGSYVTKGDVIAEVASPTKYYSVEGTNVYFKLTKDGIPVNPMSRLN